MTKHGYLKNRKSNAVYQNNAKISCWYQKRYYRNERARRVTYVWHGLSESFSHYASQLHQIIRVKLDQKHTLNQEDHKPLGKQYEYICRIDANRHRRYRNTNRTVILALIPRTEQLHKYYTRYEEYITKTKISHILQMTI